MITSGGRIEEQVVITKPLTLSASPQDPATIQWQTAQPYQSTITVSRGGQVTLENVIVRHSSPSVANNYAIFVQGGKAEVTGCDISSSTGSGIGIEGGAVTATSSKIHDCQGNGAVIAGLIDDAAGGDVSEEPSAQVSHQAAHIICNFWPPLLLGAESLTCAGPVCWSRACREWWQWLNSTG